MCVSMSMRACMNSFCVYCFGKQSKCVVVRVVVVAVAVAFVKKHRECEKMNWIVGASETVAYV